MIVFLNKKDLFAEKIERVPLRDDRVGRFTDYDGAPGDVEAAHAYLTKKFEQRFAQAWEGRDAEEKEVYLHVTCATDTRNVKVVFDACKDIILNQMLGDSGLI